MRWGRKGRGNERRPGACDGTGWPVYLAAGILYVTLGALWPPLLFSWVVGAGFLIACVVLLPLACDRLRR